MMTAGRLLQLKGPETWTISPGATVFEALELMAAKDIGALPVVLNDELVGIFSERDYARKGVLQGKRSQHTQVGQLMTSNVFFVKPQRSMEDCMRLMTDKHIRHLPVLEYGRLIGIITIGDVVKAIISQQQQVISDLENYVTGSMYQ